MTERKIAIPKKRPISKAKFASAIESADRHVSRLIFHARFNLGEIGTGDTLSTVLLKLVEAKQELKIAAMQFEARRQCARVARREAGEARRRAKENRSLV